MGLTLTVSFVTAGTMVGQDEEISYPYVPPWFGTALFESGEEQLNPVQRDEVQRLLTDIIWNPLVSGMTRGQAMALAYALGNRRDVVQADFYFRYADSRVADIASFSQGPNRETLATIISRIGPFVNNLPSSKLLPYLGDIRTGLYNNGNEPMADWTNAFPEGDKMNEILKRRNLSEVIHFERPGGMTAEPGEGFQRRQSLITGLLVLVLEGSNYAGGASQMNATVVRGISGQPSRVMFNQEVGEMMESGLDKVVTFIDNHEAEIPLGYRVEISFESQYSPKDGDSASVACALLLNSLIKGEEIDSGFAVTGALETDGMVKAVGGIDGKIRGATRRKCTHVAIPAVNEEVLLDMLLVDGIEPMAAIQVFTIETFEAAHALATPKDQREEDLKQAMELFETVQRVLERGSGQRMLQNSQVQQRLRQVLELAPNHASAKMLLLSAMGRAPRQLSLRGSLTALDRAALPLIQGLDNDGFRGATSALETDEFATASSQLKRLRPTLDARAWGAADAIAEFSELFRVLRNSPPKSDSGRRDLANK
ncbi:MAG: S16 family serine protease, partial [Verrucomicrobiota bacterium]